DEFDRVPDTEKRLARYAYPTVAGLLLAWPGDSGRTGDSQNARIPPNSVQEIEAGHQTVERECVKPSRSAGASPGMTEELRVEDYRPILDQISYRFQGLEVPKSMLMVLSTAANAVLPEPHRKDNNVHCGSIGAFYKDRLCGRHHTVGSEKMISQQLLIRARDVLASVRLERTTTDCKRSRPTRSRSSGGLGDHTVTRSKQEEDDNLAGRILPGVDYQSVVVDRLECRFQILYHRTEWPRSIRLWTIDVLHYPRNEE
ncbi:hypothetical protein FOZ63_005803, partial [Perkinsus olseni]